MFSVSQIDSLLGPFASLSSIFGTEIFDFSTYDSGDGDAKTFQEVSQFLIDAFTKKKRVVYFFSLCQLAAKSHISWSDFATSVKGSTSMIVKISTPAELQTAYLTHLPDVSRSKVKRPLEVWQYIGLGLTALCKPSEYAKAETYMIEQRQRLGAGANSLAATLSAELFQCISAQSPNLGKIRALVVQWVLQEAKTSSNPLNKNLRHLSQEWRGAHMTHILIIKEEIWEKRAHILTVIKKESQPFVMLKQEIEKFESVVMSRASNQNFEYLRLLEVSNVFAEVSQRNIPILSHAAIELAVRDKPQLKGYAKKIHPCEGAMNIIAKDYILSLVRLSKEGAAQPPTASGDTFKKPVSRATPRRRKKSHRDKYDDYDTPDDCYSFCKDDYDLSPRFVRDNSDDDSD